MNKSFKSSTGGQFCPVMTFKAQEGQVDQLQIFGEIDGEEVGGFGVKDLAFKMLTSQGEKLQVLINSPGGSVTEGNAIAAILKGSKKQVTTHGVGLVASIATIILLAGDKVKLEKNAFFMIHNPWAFAVGEAQELESTANVLKAMQANLLGVYVSAIQKRGKLLNNSVEETREQVKKMMNQETWFTAQEALEAGFIDEITEGAKFKATAQGYLDKVLKFKNTPIKLLNKLKTKTNNQQAGANLAGLLEAAIEEILAANEEETRANLVEQISEAADRSTSTINQILAGEIDDPAQEVLEAFVEVLGVPMEEIEAALESDGVEEEEEGEEAQGGDPQEEEEEEEIETLTNLKKMNNKKETGLWSFVKSLFASNPEKVEEIKKEVELEATAQQNELAQAKAILAKHGVRIPEQKEEVDIEAIVEKRIQEQLAKASKDFDFNKEERERRKGAPRAGASKLRNPTTKKAHNKARAKAFGGFKNYLVSRAEKG